MEHTFSYCITCVTYYVAIVWHVCIACFDQLRCPIGHSSRHECMYAISTSWLSLCPKCWKISQRLQSRGMNLSGFRKIRFTFCSLHADFHTESISLWMRLHQTAGIKCPNTHTKRHFLFDSRVSTWAFWHITHSIRIGRHRRRRRRCNHNTVC